MDLNPLKKIKEAVNDATTQKTLELMNNVNTILAALPDAGYEIERVELELGITPQFVANLKIHPNIREEKLREVIQGNPNNLVVSTAINALLQAGKMRDVISVSNLILQEVTLSVATTPTVKLQWKEKAAAREAAA
jgi:hypothetical protein